MSILTTTRRRALAAGLVGLSVASVLAGCSAASSATDRSDASSTDKSVTLYTADGLGDGDSSFYTTVFKDFQEDTGITVHVVEAGSGEVVQRVAKEQANTQADVLVTLPPFIQRADRDGLLAKYTPKGSEHVADDNKAADGTYTLNTYGTGDGAVVGRHTVTVERYLPPMPTQPGGKLPTAKSSIPARYTKPETSPLKVEVKSGT